MERARNHLNSSLLENQEVVSRIETVCRYLQNRACTRFILACTLAKADRPHIDIRKPYTEIHDSDVYSGRSYDERYLTGFIREHDLPCNSTTAFLTPAFRNRNVTLTPDIEMVGRPKSLYVATLQLLTDVQTGVVSASDMLAEILRVLLIIRDEQRQRLNTLLVGMKPSDHTAPLSAEAIVTLIDQHLQVRGSSRLPVLIVAAAYRAASALLAACRRENFSSRSTPFLTQNLIVS
ncbi:MAG: DNA methyltransferase, partial [Aggregatilineales bacterium]